MSADDDRGSLHAVVLRLEALEYRMAELERAVVGGGGFRCACCKTVRPSNWFLYEAFNPETKEIIKPLCGSCVQLSAVGGLPWRYQGPFRQKAQNAKNQAPASDQLDPCDR